MTALQANIWTVETSTKSGLRMVAEFKTREEAVETFVAECKRLMRFGAKQRWADRSCVIFDKGSVLIGNSYVPGYWN